MVPEGDSLKRPPHPVRTFQQALNAGRIAITADLTLTSASGPGDIARQVELFGAAVDGLQVSDNPFAWTQMSALSAAVLVQQQGTDAIPVLNCRDRNRLALTAELLGLRALGVKSVLLTRGEKLPDAHPVKAAPVFDTTGRELVALAAQLGEGEDVPPGEDFFIGVGARAFRPARNWKAESLLERSGKGAQFLQTQLCFNTDILREYLRALVEHRITWKYSVVVSLAALPSAATARWLKQNMSDSRIPEALVKRLDGAADQEQEGIRICAELMQEIARVPGVSGINLMTMGNAEHMAEAIRLSELRA